MTFQHAFTPRLAANVDHITAKHERLEALYNLAELQPPADELDEPSTPKVKSARSQNRAATWRYDLVMWREYRLAHATCDFERDRIEQDYAELAAHGPDFLHHRPRSAMCTPPLNRLPKGAKDAALACFNRVADWDWAHRRNKHGQSVSLKYGRVLEVLHEIAEEHGFVYPSLKEIARRARCCVRTAVNALDWLRLWGFVDWQRRLRQAKNTLGKVVVRQTSNAYRLARDLATIGAKVWGRWQQVASIRTGEIDAPETGTILPRQESGAG